MGIFKEFKEFAVKGNAIDMAVGIIIGATFGKIVSSLVGDIIMPLIGILMGGVDFTGLKAEIMGATVKYGMFIQNLIDFIIIAFAIFMMVRMINKLKKKEEEKPAEPTKEEALLTEIRDLLAIRRKNT